MKESRLAGLLGEGGTCAEGAVGEAETEAGGGVVSVCSGCSACVAVVGEESSEWMEK